MTKDVLIAIRGLQLEEMVDNEELDKIETICAGEYYYRNNTHYVLYDEVMEGVPGVTRNMIKMKETEFSLTKKGPVNVQMVFTEGKKTMTSYDTPFGSILIAMDTDKVELTEKENKIQMKLTYILEANYEYLAECHITVEVVPRAEGNDFFQERA